MQIAQSEIEEFSYSARNEMDWLNEHMAEIFSENQMFANPFDPSGGAELTYRPRSVAELCQNTGKIAGKDASNGEEDESGEARVVRSFARLA